MASRTSSASRNRPWCDCATPSARACISTSGSGTDGCACRPWKATTSSATSPRSESPCRCRSVPQESFCSPSPTPQRRRRSCDAWRGSRSPPARRPSRSSPPSSSPFAPRIGRSPSGSARKDWPRPPSRSGAQSGAVQAALSISGPTARLDAQRLDALRPELTDVGESDQCRAGMGSATAARRGRAGSLISRASAAR